MVFKAVVLSYHKKLNVVSSYRHKFKSKNDALTWERMYNKNNPDGNKVRIFKPFRR